MRRIAWMLAVVAIVAAAIAVFAPATLADARLASLSGGTLRLADARGTLWRGRGVLTSPEGRWRVPVDWVWRPGALLAGVTSIELHMPEHAPHGVRGRLELGERRVVADGLLVRAPASVIASIAGKTALDAGGDVELRSDASTLVVDDGTAGNTGAVGVQWRHAHLATTGAPSVDVGTITSRLTARGNTWTGPVSSKGGAVDVSGDISIGTDRITADLRLMPRPGAPATLLRALQQLGPADANGAFALRVDRRMR